MKELQKTAILGTGQYCGKHDMKELQKTAILGTGQYCGNCDCQCRTLNMGNNITRGTNCNNRTAATLCTVGTWFGSVV
jgi:hypothetical protein